MSFFNSLFGPTKGEQERGLPFRGRALGPLHFSSLNFYFSSFSSFSSRLPSADSTGRSSRPSSPALFWKGPSRTRKRTTHGCFGSSLKDKDSPSTSCATHQSSVLICILAGPNTHICPKHAQMWYIFAKTKQRMNERRRRNRSFWDARLFLQRNVSTLGFIPSLFLHLKTDLIRRIHVSIFVFLSFSSPCPAKDWFRHGQGSKRRRDDKDNRQQKETGCFV